MTTKDSKKIPAYFLRAQEFSRQKREREQREYERRSARRQRVTQRLAAVLGEKTQEVHMDESHPERIYIKEQHIEKVMQLLDGNRTGALAAQFALANQLVIWYPETKDKIYYVHFEELDGYTSILRPYLEPADPDDPMHLAQEQAKLTQKLNQIAEKIKGVTMDELKSKMLTLLSPGEVVTVSKPDPAAPAGPVLVKDDPPAEEAPASIPEPVPTQ